VQVVRHDQGPAKHILYDELYVFAFQKIIHTLYLRSLQCSLSVSLPQFQLRQMVSSWISRGTRHTTPHETEITPARATLLSSSACRLLRGKIAAMRQIHSKPLGLIVFVCSHPGIHDLQSLKDSICSRIELLIDFVCIYSSDSAEYSVA
jgi:hypothetical protein